MTVSTTISSVCSVSIVSNVSFGTIASQSVSTTDTTGSFSVTCSTGTAYSIALDLGGNANVSTRRMKSGTSNYLTYELYSDNARTAIWRTAISGYTGTNSAQTQTVYARLPSQLAPAPGVYTDTVTITVTY
jgi:spore coat protein U-like protein